jgi:regulator of chromosome condensation
LIYSIEPPSAISAGACHYGIIDNKGNLYMGGDGDDGQIGGGESTRKKNNPPTPLDLGSKVICISCGGALSGAVTERGEVYVWGSMGISNPNPIFLIPTLVPLNKAALKISVSYRDYIILLEDHSIYYYYHRAPMLEDKMPVSGYLTDIRARDICSCGQGFIMVTQDYHVYIYKILYSGELERKEIIFTEPIRRAASDLSSFAALSISGNLYTWGNNMFGTLGQDDFVDKDKPTKVNIGKKISYISLGWEMMAAITDGGELYMWGHNREEKIMSQSMAEKIGILNDVYGNIYYSLVNPIELELPASSSFASQDIKSKKVKEVGVGGTFVMALTEDGEINVWGTFSSTFI